VLASNVSEGQRMVEQKRKLSVARRKQREAFIEKFGREPGPDDPVFFDPDYDTPVALSEKKLRAHALEAMRAAEIPPYLVYAYAKTGFIVNELRYKQMSSADRAEYNAAIEEYFVTKESQEHGDRN
jgi:hypothetical protein